MKKTAIVLLIVSIAAIVWYFFVVSSSKTLSPLSSIKVFPSVIPAVTIPVQKKSTALFVPYWAMGQKNIGTNDINTLLYFGVSGTVSGIDTSDVGYQRLQAFTKQATDTTEKLLVVRMIDSDTNSKILGNKNAQQKIILDSIEIAKKNSFSGIVLDFEIKALAFDSVIKNITSFYTDFANATHKSKLQFDATLYGDTYYLARPYDVKAIGDQVDHLYIMTYDFHKAGGNPGPNFPLSGKEKYGYDLSTMIKDFSKQVAVNKLIVTFGLFGYDWTVNNNNESESVALPLSFLEIKSKYMDNCSEKNCTISHDKKTLETNITFSDKDGKKHTIWFEDPESMEKKKEFLATKGLHATAIWAYSYY